MASVQSSQVVKAIRKIVRAIDLRSREVSRSTGLTIPQIVVLQGVRDMGEVTTKALSEHVDLSSSTVVTILDKLEAKDLVERYRSASDRRIVHARLTQKGEEVVADVPGLLHEEFERKFADLQAGERADMIAAIEQIAEMMNADKLDAAPLLMTGKVQD
ncbi:MarR family winged helix-turn-helix transcriptional regulator [Roseibium aggregatum]|uniref:MarR family transcriptional regulator n=1 Tax=Roseibium aggregatum TaxID=187304 RepID=A0A939J3Y9_9HYPH|nr:MarR family transcriptional regulator [Roseibium aggregatum]MBN9671082.1 MarR family transcriptional regulator [Roseibium aggregatum]